MMLAIMNNVSDNTRGITTIIRDASNSVSKFNHAFITAIE